jgi:hypothetical protein
VVQKAKAKSAIKAKIRKRILTPETPHAKKGKSHILEEE